MKKNYYKIVWVLLLTFAILIGKSFFVMNRSFPLVKNQVFASEPKTDNQASQTAAAERPAGEITIPILMYHHVGDLPSNPDSTRKDLTLPTASFRSQAEWLAEQGYQSISLKQLYLYKTGNFDLPLKPIIFTFDDGYEDVFKNAVPILKHYDFSGSFAVITQWPGQTQGDNVYASWDEITAAQNQGMEIVCHTQNHFDGSSPKFNSDYVLQNLLGCKKDLAGHNISTNILVYPYGHYTADYIKLADKAGFAMGITTREGDKINLGNLMEIPRVRVHGAENLGRFKDILVHKIYSSPEKTATDQNKASL